jgi:hypothetical protein
LGQPLPPSILRYGRRPKTRRSPSKPYRAPHAAQMAQTWRIKRNLIPGRSRWSAERCSGQSLSARSNDAPPGVAPHRAQCVLQAADSIRRRSRRCSRLTAGSRIGKTMRSAISRNIIRSPNATWRRGCFDDICRTYPTGGKPVTVGRDAVTPRADSTWKPAAANSCMRIASISKGRNQRR